VLFEGLMRGKVWQNWVTWYAEPGHVVEWHSPEKTASERVCYRLQTRTVERLSAQHPAALATFLGFRNPL